MATRIHLADDHTMFREGLASILTSSGGDVEVVSQSSTSGEDAVALIEGNKPDVVITEIDGDLNTATGILSRIRSLSPTSRIIVLTMFDNLHYLKALSKLGIDAYVHKSSSTEELIAIISTLSGDPDGKNVVVSMPRGLIERLGEEPAGALSERETEIVVLAARGLSNLQIARELRISEATVKRHLANVYVKIGVGSRSEAVRKALVEQWIGLIRIAPPEVVEEEMRAFEPHLLVRNDTDGIDHEVLASVPCWVEMLYSDSMDAKISVDGRVEEARDISTEDLLRVADEAAAMTRET